MLPDRLPENPTALALNERFPDGIVDAKFALDELTLDCYGATIGPDLPGIEVGFSVRAPQCSNRGGLVAQFSAI